MPTYAGSYSGRPAYSIRGDFSRYGQPDLGANASRYSARLYIRHDTAATNNSWANTARGWAIEVDNANPAVDEPGWYEAGTAPFAMGPTGDYVGKEITLWSGVTDWITHNPDGTLTLAVSGRHLMAPDVQGNASFSGLWVTAPIPRNIVRLGDDDDEWIDAGAYVGINDAWIPALPHAGVDDTWKELQLT